MMKRTLDKLSTEEMGRLFPITISEFDPSWKDLFLSEKQTIQKAIGLNNIISIEHIGSTSIPGLAAKPTIDILVQIHNETEISKIIGKLKATGYDSIPKPDNPPPHLMLAKGYSPDGLTGQTFHMHIRYRGDWDEIVFRDYLTRNNPIAEEYAVLKRKLSIEFRNDREKYTDAKTGFIKDIVGRARKELENNPYF